MAEQGRHHSAGRMMDALQKANIATWFDLGLMLDRLRDGRATPSLSFDDDFDTFARSHTEAEASSALSAVR